MRNHHRNQTIESNTNLSTDIGVLDYIGAMYVEIDSNNIVTAVNDSACRVLGYSKEEIIGNNWFEKFVPLSEDLELAGPAKAMDQFYDKPVLTKNGEERLVSWRKSIVKNKSGGSVRHICVGEDISTHENYLFTLHQIASLLLKDIQEVPFKKFVKLIAEASNADHTYIFINEKEGRNKLVSKRICEWGRGQLIENGDSDFEEFVISDFDSGLITKLVSGQIIHRRVASFPEKEKAFLSRIGIKAILIIPILVNGEFFGFIGFDNRVNEREWTYSEIEFLKASVKNLEQKIQNFRVNEALRNEHARFQATMDSIEVIVLVSDFKPGKIIYSNSFAHKELGDVINKTPREALELNHANIEQPSPIDYLVKNNKATEIKVCELISGGSGRAYSCQTKAIKWVNGEWVRLETIIDITERKGIERELITQKNKAEESNHLKTQFLNNLSHEIRTPLNGIVGFTQFLSDPNLSEDKLKSFVSIIQNSSHQLVRIMDDIIEISKLETKQVKPLIEPFNLNSILLETFSIFELKAIEKGVALHLKRGLSDIQSEIRTDKTKLLKIINNLVENALKFTHKGEVEIGYGLTEKRLSLWVKDTGIGIEPNTHHLIFDRFSQAKTSSSNSYGGLGLGLSIAKENVELLGGEIYVDSKPGDGAKFYFQIPYDPVFVSEVNSVDEGQDKSNEYDFKVLIAEDEEVNFIYLEFLLQNMTNSIQVFHARNGQEAIDYFETGVVFDLVFMDLKMPEVNGIEATKHIKKKHPKTPIIAITAFSGEEDKQSAFDAGCEDFITKPITADHFNDKCRLFLSA